MSAWNVNRWSAYSELNILYSKLLSVCRTCNNVCFRLCLDRSSPSLFCQSLLEETYWYLSELNLIVFLFAGVYLVGLIGVCLQCFLSKLIPSVSPLPTSVWRILLISVWTEPSVSLASVCLVNPIGVCLKCFPTSFAGSIWRDHLMFLWFTQYLSCLCLSDEFWSVSV